MASLRDKVILITGSGDTSGIGAVTAEYLVQFRPKLVLTGRDPERLALVQEMCVKAGAPTENVLVVSADLDKDDDLERLVHTAVSTFDRLDVLVNNAAIVRYHTTLETSMDEFDQVLRTNLRAPFYLSKLCLPHLTKTKGAIINISSISANRVYQGEAAYAISKAGLDQLTKILSIEVGDKGVRVNSVNPTVIRSNIQRKGGMAEERYKQYVEGQGARHPLGRIGEPVEVAKVIAFLASDDSAYISGQIMMVDGGRQHMSV